MAYKGSDDQVQWSDNTFVRWESQRRKIRKGRADHGPRYRSTQLPLQHLDLTISGGVRLCQPHFIGKEHFVQVDARSQVNSCPHGSISTFHSTMRMTLLPVRSLQSLNLKQAAHLPNEIDRTNASLIIYNFFWYSNMAENMTNQNVCCRTCLHFPEMDQGSKSDCQQLRLKKSIWSQ
ncbi:hypothetical protein T02_4252 [Trichinella nativa]|uniref:Uncharacterized protein n=1 Tax=Trichinella nativa TaxID=6335 RepID=A0A0V1LQ48_9BILA|nr:hypothetical protein T02_4252 [Trichinella nativa]